MGKESGNEMEQIQRSLEQFIADIKEEIAGRVNRPVTVETKENK